MQIRVTDDLSSLSVWAEGAELVGMLGEDANKPLCVWTDKNPVLMTDTAKIAALPSGPRDLLFSLYATYPRSIVYDGVEVSWTPQSYPRVWGPSIDTVWFAMAMKPLLKNIRSAAEIGTGSGFLSKYMLAHAPQLERLVATDINPSALQCAQDNIGADGRAAFVAPEEVGLGLEGKFDLIICNPPYIPRPHAHTDNPYEGLALIGLLAETAREHLNEDGALLINVSSVSGDDLLDQFPGALLMEQMQVPLKVNVVTNDISESSRAWITYLKDNNLVMDMGPGSGHRYWHKLRLYMWPAK